MNKPLMTAEQTNIPRNEEELAAAMEKKAIADAAEQKAHEAARNKEMDQPHKGHVSDEEKQYHEKLAELTHETHRVQWAFATATNTLTHHINSVLYTAAVIVANAKTPEEQARILGYITKQAMELRALKANQQEQPSNGN